MRIGKITFGTSRDDQLEGTHRNDIIIGRKGDDIIHAGNGNDLLSGGQDNDVLVGGRGSDLLIGGSGDDILYAESSQTTNDSHLSGLYSRLAELLGNAFFSAGFGSSFLGIGFGNSFFGMGLNTFKIDFFSFNGSSFLGKLWPIFRGDTLIGGEGNDQLYGGFRNDWLYGDNGLDRLSGAQGNDSIDGGADIDTVVFSGNRADYLVTELNGNQLQIQDTVFHRDGVDTIRNVELFEFSDGVYTLDQLLNNQVNQPPEITNLISDQVATEDQLFAFILPVNTFTDPEEGSQLTLNATLTNGSPLPSWLSFDPDTGEFSGTPAQNDVGDIIIRVTATDSDGASTFDDFVIATAQVNEAPIVQNEIDNQNLTEDQPFALDVSNNIFLDEEDGTSLTLSATLVDGSPLPDWLSFDGAQFSGTPPQGDIDDIIVRVTATDAGGLTIFDDFVISVAEVNDTPIVQNEIDDQSVTEDQLFTFDVPSNAFLDEEDGSSLTLSATLVDGSPLPDWLSFDGAQFSGTPLQDDIDDITVRVTATDAGGLTIFDDFVISVAEVNDTPIVQNEIDDQSATEDQLFTFDVPSNIFLDEEDGSSLTLSATLVGGSALPDWLSFDGAQFSGTPPQGDIDDITVRVTATDAGGLTTFDDFVISVAEVNDTPVVQNEIDDQNATEDQLFTFDLPTNAFLDEEDGTSLTLSATLVDGSPLPRWLSFDGAQFSGTPAQNDAGDITIRVTATDSDGASIFDDFVITTAQVNDAPVVQNNIDDQNLTEDQPFTLDVSNNTFLDEEDGTSLTLSATLVDGSALPDWLSFDGTQFSGTPLQGSIDDITVRVTATDAGGLSTFDDFVISVAEVNDAPVVQNEIDNQNLTEDQPFALDVSNNIFLDEEDGSSLTLSATLVGGSELPDWLSFDGIQFSGTPLQGSIEDITVRVTATDAGGLTTFDDFVISVTEVNDTPIVQNEIDDQNATEDQLFTFDVPNNVFLDEEDGSSLTLSATLVDGSPLPRWLSFDGAQFSGTPAQNDAADITIRVTATDSDGASTFDDFVIATAEVNDAPVVQNEIDDQNATEDQFFTFDVPNNAFLDEEDGSSLTLSATLVDGSALPDWLSFDGAQFSGTPLQGDIEDITVRVTATDAGGLTTFDDFVISVIDVNEAPVVQNTITDQSSNLGEAFSLIIPNDTFNDLEDGHNLTLSAKLASGSALPDWLNFNPNTGELSGTPSQPGNITVRITASDSAGSSVSTDFTFRAIYNEVNLIEQPVDNGFYLSTETSDFTGVSVGTAGDFNNDGFEDFLIGAMTGDPNGKNNAGETYLIFGSDNPLGLSEIDLKNLDPNEGFTIQGAQSSSYSGTSVSYAGDLNGDGFDDIIIGAPLSNSPGGNDSGISHVVFGTDSDLGGTFNLTNLNGHNGFSMYGINSNDQSGIAVSYAGDLNNDGLDDVLINTTSGQSYVVFGSDNTFNSTLELSFLDGNNGFILNGALEEDHPTFGEAGNQTVRHAGDINGDGIDDILIGTPGSNDDTGKTYVVFGSSTGFDATIDLQTLDGSNGFVITGISPGDYFGASVSTAGDINQDGIDDIIIGAPQTDPTDSGVSYVIYGSDSGFNSNLDLSSLDGSNGFVIQGIAGGDKAGFSVSSAGDFNGDGFDDLILGATGVDLHGNSEVGQSYLLLGNPEGFDAIVNLTSLNGFNGFVLNGYDESEQAGHSVSKAGDINGDGFDDLIIGSPSSDKAYVIYGNPLNASSGLNLEDTFVFTTTDMAMNTQAALIDHFDQGIDHIDVSDFGFLDSSDFTITEVDGSSLIDLNNDAQQDIQVQGVTGLTDADFIF